MNELENNEPMVVKCEGCGYQTMIWGFLGTCPKCSCAMIQIKEIKYERQT